MYNDKNIENRKFWAFDDRELRIYFSFYSWISPSLKRKIENNYILCNYLRVIIIIYLCKINDRGI